MPSVEVRREVIVAAAPDQVAGVLVDLPRWPEWFALHEGWTRDPPARAVKGTTFQHKVRILGMPGDVEWRVLTADHPGHYRLKGKGSRRTGAEIDFRVAPVPEGSRLEVAASLSGLAVKPFEAMLKPWLDARLRRSIDGLRERLAE